MYYRIPFLILYFFLISSFSFSKDLYVYRNLIHMWDFEDKVHYEVDVKNGADALLQGKIKWVPPDFSFNQTGVIHIHGDKMPESFFTIPARYTDRDLDNWTLDFEFAIGTHPVDHKDHNPEQGRIMDGVVVEWGDLKVTYFEMDDRWRGKIVVEYRQRIVNIPGVSAFDYHHMVLRSEPIGISVWLNTSCIKLIHTPRTPMRLEEIKFASNGFAGRLDNIKIYDERLKPWEITQNYWGTELNVDLKSKFITTWAEVKKEKK